MASVPNNGPLRPITPQQPQPSNPRHIAAPSQLLPVQTAGARPLSNLGPLSPVNQNGSFAFDRVIKTGKVNRRVKKKGAWRSSWKPAYLVLRPNLLSVYKDKDENELRASIRLSDVTAVAPVKKSHHEHVFGIFSPAKNYHFSGLSARETSDWITILRMESRTEEQDDLQPPHAGFAHGDNQGYETTDLSADEDLAQPGSPEAPRWTVKGQKSRVAPQANTDPRRTSSLAPYSGNEAFTTSQSDFSDGFSSSLPGSKGYLSASVPVQASPLTPIPDEVPSTSRPAFDRGASYLSDTGTTPFPTMSKSAPKQASIPQQQDPSRVVRQGHLKLLKTVSGVKQWKSIWMVLRSQTLAVYKSNNEYSPLFIMPTYAIIEAAEIDRKHKQNCFQIIGEEKTYRLQAETEDELENWLGSFKSVLVKQEAERSSRHASVSAGSALQGPGEQQGSGASGMQPPRSREGTGGISAQMRNVFLENQNMVPGARRVMSPPSMGTSTHAQVTSPAV
ncbi:hypothetical protein OHC33_010618 [Knufia fluminis]|uniref:PH domain-containing protein n=1 Tax=Knufia fluminis TaxID=191047 RepID=A0AAN8ECS2_9EURO|nr:hypothetical protein OHC33_010618 [Knufia fluminis]